MKNEISSGNFVLASLLCSYPDGWFADSVKELLTEEEIILPIELREKIEKLLDSASALDDLRSEYIAIFDHSKIINPLYETEYGRERAMFKANELSDIAGFYLAFGFELDNDEGVREMIDHISVELEFYGLMMMKYLKLQSLSDATGCEIVNDGMKKFMNDHLGRFSESICGRPGVQASEFYLGVFEWISMIVKQECGRLGVAPEKITWLASQVEDEKMSCGATVAMNK